MTVLKSKHSTRVFDITRKNIQIFIFFNKTFAFRIIIMFYLIGLGLGDAKDITVKGLEIVKKCERVYLEAYTSILTVGVEVLVSLIY